MKNDCCIVVTTAPSKKSAKKIAHSIMDNNLAMCIQYFVVDSIYRWGGKINSDLEYRLEIKTTCNFIKNIDNLIQELHEYSTPELIVIDIADGNKEYLDWINKLNQ